MRIEGVASEGADRLDRFVSDALSACTRSQFKARFVSAAVNGRPAKPSRPLKPGDRYLVELADEEDRSSATRPESIELSVLYEDGSVIVVDKPQGMVTHPAHGNWSGTLANALLGRAAGGPIPPRAGIVHRLDKDTSGVIVAGKTAAAQDYLASQFRDRTTVKVYAAIVIGRPPAPRGRRDGWLARDPRERKRWAESAEGVGKRAVTDWVLVAESGGYSVLALRPRTGRTHQLRVHCKAMGCPILGDPIYGRPDRRFKGATLMLHALSLRILLPGGEEAVFEAPPPARMVEAAAALGLSIGQDLNPWASPGPR